MNKQAETLVKDGPCTTPGSRGAGLPAGGHIPEPSVINTNYGNHPVSDGDYQTADDSYEDLGDNGLGLGLVMRTPSQANRTFVL
ncbi:hypothetical protein Metme_1666 [Methylomonas methanica MC09]|uniref:Uncharacterized protein n=1 Tax=Methylomonas methanica (strain DSM 25384 / MC09) TaxID=857087 RepID=G0A1M4_METMM|nr:hypothetical protein Metme_1666 [Methylomonas methanica MC09]